MNTILQVKSLRKTYAGEVALKGLNISVKKGQVYGILGPNGSGKTTTLGILLGVLHPDSGYFNWFKGEKGNSYKKEIGALLETPNFYPYLNAIDNLKIVATIKSLDNETESIEKALKTVNLWFRRKASFSSYSLGMKQRLAIASAILGDPEVLVLDEPTNGLDPQGIKEIRALILDISARGKTIIIASHILDEIEKVCTDVAILKNGELIREARLSEILIQDKVLSIAGENLDAIKVAIEEIPNLTYLQSLDTHILIGVSAELSEAEVNKAFVEKGIYLSRLKVHKRSLESMFLEIINT